MRGSTCCWTLAPKPQSPGRTPQPLTGFGSRSLVNTLVPNAELVIAWHSPLMPGFSRSHCGTKSLFASFHVRVVDVCSRPLGRSAAYARPFCAAWRYLPTLILIDVLPLPKTSIARPPRGVMSLYAFTPCVYGKLIAVGRNRSGPTVTAGK